MAPNGHTQRLGGIQVAHQGSVVDAAAGPDYSISRTPTEPMNSSAVIGKPGGGIHLAPSMRMLTRCAPGATGRVMCHTSSPTSVNSIAFQSVKSALISTL